MVEGAQPWPSLHGGPDEQLPADASRFGVEVGDDEDVMHFRFFGVTGRLSRGRLRQFKFHAFGRPHSSNTN